jgi:Trp operon repressor
LARELSQDSRLRLAKNRDQREAAFRLFFGKSSNKIDSYEIERIAQRAIGIFEIETLPKLVQDLLNNCQSAKEISENLGISLAKVKKVIAAIS